jgi:hypothetical protein
VHANLVNLQVSGFWPKGVCEVVGPSSLWSGGDWVGESSRMSDTHYRVQGGHTVVVQFDLSECACGFELASSWSCGPVAFQNEDVVSGWGTVLR